MIHKIDGDGYIITIGGFHMPGIYVNKQAAKYAEVLIGQGKVDDIRNIDNGTPITLGQLAIIQKRSLTHIQ